MAAERPKPENLCQGKRHEAVIEPERLPKDAKHIGEVRTVTLEYETANGDGRLGLIQPIRIIQSVINSILMYPIPWRCLQLLLRCETRAPA